MLKDVPHDLTIGAYLFIWISVYPVNDSETLEGSASQLSDAEIDVPRRQRHDYRVKDC